MLRYRQKLIKVRTMSKNSLQAIALQAGLAKGKQLFSAAGQEQFRAAELSPALQWQRDHWFELLKPLNQQLLETMAWFKAHPKPVGQFPFDTRKQETEECYGEFNQLSWHNEEFLSRINTLELIRLYLWAQRTRERVNRYNLNPK